MGAGPPFRAGAAARAATAPPPPLQSVPSLYDVSLRYRKELSRLILEPDQPDTLVTLVILVLVGSGDTYSRLLEHSYLLADQISASR
jgi:hypothetical protein